MPKGGVPEAPKLAVRAKARGAKPHAGGLVAAVTAPPNVAPLVSDPLPGEGQWQPTGRLVDGRPGLWVTFVRPDAVHTSLLAGIAHLDMSRLEATVHPGTDIPGGGPWANAPQIGAGEYPYVVAAFNSAFRLDNSRGGYCAEGRTVKALDPGRASLVTYADGHVDVGIWGRNEIMAPSVTAVRQNLDLIVDGGARVPGLADANNGLWGGTVGNNIYVWRSGVRRRCARQSRLRRGSRPQRRHTG